jgi:hypothetical protein
MTKLDFRKAPPNPPFLPITEVLAGVGDRLNLSDDQLDIIANELEASFSKRMFDLWDTVPNAYTAAQSVWDAAISIEVGQCPECQDAGLIGQRCKEDVVYLSYFHPRTKKRQSIIVPWND